MKNITLAIDERSLELGRKYAKKRNISFNALVRKLLQQTIQTKKSDWLEETFIIAEKEKASSRGKKWTREETHERR